MGVKVEHIVQDACSTDGSAEWLRTQPSIISRIEKDSGMYDAINRGMSIARGKIVAYLNADEQYLPGALKRVLSFFEENPQVDMLFCSAIITNNTGTPLAIRTPLMPSATYVRTCMLPLLTCSMFMRSGVLERVKPMFDIKYRVIGDADFFLRARDAGVRMTTVTWATSIFSDTGENLGFKALEEMPQLNVELPPVMVKLRPLWIRIYQFRKALRGLYRRRLVSVAIYTTTKPETRVQLSAMVSERWVGR